MPRERFSVEEKTPTKTMLKSPTYFFDVDNGELQLIIQRNSCPVTWRSIVVYEYDGQIPPGFIDQAVSDSLQVIEVGPGLAEFLPELAIRCPVAPVAIDPVDYASLISDLEQLTTYGVLSKSGITEIGTLIGRAQTMLSPRIKLFPFKLEDALALHPDDLVSKADFVIDSRAAQTYSRKVPYLVNFADMVIRGDKHEVTRMEQSMLKDVSRFVSYINGLRSIDDPTT